MSDKFMRNRMEFFHKKWLDARQEADELREELAKVKCALEPANEHLMELPPEAPLVDRVKAVVEDMLMYLNETKKTRAEVIKSLRDQFDLSIEILGKDAFERWWASRREGLTADSGPEHRIKAAFMAAWDLQVKRTTALEDKVAKLQEENTSLTNGTLERFRENTEKMWEGMMPAMKEQVSMLRKERDAIADSRDWYRRRLEMLEKEQLKMREPERTIVCDIIANGKLLPDPDEKRYGPRPETLLEMCEIFERQIAYEWRSMENGPTRVFMQSVLQSVQRAHRWLDQVKAAEASPKPECPHSKTHLIQSASGNESVVECLQCGDIVS